MPLAQLCPLLARTREDLFLINNPQKFIARDFTFIDSGFDLQYVSLNTVHTFH